MKPFIIRITMFLLLSFCLFSCKENTVKKEIIVKSVNKIWKGKKIVFQSSIIPLSDTKQMNKQSKYTILGFYDGHCSVCYGELVKWRKIIQDYKKKGFDDVVYKFVLSGNSKAYVGYSLKELGFPIDLVYYDSKDIFSSEYQFVNESGYKYSAMLLDENNKILFIGNPTIYKKDNDRFLEIIKNN